MNDFKFEINESTESEFITLNPDQNRAKQGATVTRWVAEGKELYTFRPEPMKYRPWDGYYNAGVVLEREFGMITGNSGPSGMFGEAGAPPVIHTLNIQDMKVQSKNGLVEFARSDIKGNVFGLKELIEIARTMGLEDELPRFPTADDKEEIRDLLLKDCQVIGVTSNEVRVHSGTITVYDKGEPWGQIELGGVNDEKFGPLFAIGITTYMQNQKRAMEIGNLIAKELKANSIYKARALASSSDKPEYWDVFGQFKEDSIYLEKEAIAAFQLLIMYPIKYRKRAQERDKSMLNRKMLFYGPFGTGKTSINALLAQWALMHDWTVVRHKTGEDDLDKTLRLARLLEPSLVLVEDMEVETTSGDAAENSKNLDRFDGPTTKSGEILIVATTNHIDQLEKGMTRPGRIDGIIKVDNVSDEGIIPFLRTVGRGKKSQLNQRIDKENRKRLFDVQDVTVEYRELSDAEHDANELEIRKACHVDIVLPNGKTEKRRYSNAFLGEVNKRGSLATLNQENPEETHEDVLKAAQSLKGQFELHELAPDSHDVIRSEESLESVIQKSVVKVLEETRVDMRTGEFLK